MKIREVSVQPRVDRTARGEAPFRRILGAGHAAKEARLPALGRCCRCTDTRSDQACDLGRLHAQRRHVLRGASAGQAPPPRPGLRRR
jgi:hypothetical protein